MWWVEIGVPTLVVGGLTLAPYLGKWLNDQFFFGDRKDWTKFSRWQMQKFMDQPIEYSWVSRDYHITGNYYRPRGLESVPDNYTRDKSK